LEERALAILDGSGVKDEAIRRGPDILPSAHFLHEFKDFSGDAMLAAKPVISIRLAVAGQDRVGGKALDLS
jgi:hypothetical protein